MDDAMADRSKYEEWIDAVTGGPLGAWDLQFSQFAIRDLFRALFSEHDKMEQQVKDMLKDDDDTGDWYVDRAQSLAFMDVACSQAKVGAVAPLTETLFRRVTEKLSRKYPKPTGAGAHHRASLADEDFWNPAVLAIEGGGSQHTRWLPTVIESSWVKRKDPGNLLAADRSAFRL
jgi:hypothetical protein